MFKLVGILGLVLAMGLLGVLKAEQLKARIKALEEFMKMGLLLKSKINYLHEPLTYIFTRESVQEENRALLLLHESFAEAGQKGGQISQIWAQKADELYKTSALNNADMECIKYLGSFIGQTDYENQIYQFEYLEKMLQSQIKDATDEYKSKGPLYRKLGFFAGALIGIVLI